ncbi:hypothetical protein Agabi119p4_7186 [Agaricus bisporus var. burnettii]|uniref:WD40 repeat-like protein n=1 Tax=Agaricus bisporus var. burnettii TaxID=192524 RepID=A0A8H7EYN6_AGABI|nr:hypothetical protein Agabi119p4_7186 [Agaricus bisporus var. burnettii]
MNSPSISSGFVLPLTFAGPYNIENTCKNGQPSTPLTSVRNAQPTCMENWTRVVEDGGQVYRMVMIGCEDGSLYVFRTQDPPPSTPRDTASSIPPVVVQPPSMKNASSPSGTPPPHHPSMAVGSQSSTFWKVSPRPRAVSGVNVEQAQAPKNYVDFDDEPDKLKDLLKGKNPMTKTQSDSSSEKTIPAIPVEEPAPMRRKDVSKGSTIPGSDFGRRFGTTFPYHTSYEGNLVFLRDSFTREQLAPKDHDVLFETYIWCHLRVTTTQQTTYIFASASNHVGAVSATSDAEGVPQERTLSAVYALVSEMRPMQHTLEFLGNWELDCVTNSVNVLTNPDGKDLIFCVNTDGTLCARNLQVLPDLPAPVSETELGLNHLHIPNPFKKKSSSSDFLPQGSKINLKVLLDESQNLGQLSFHAPLRGFVLYPGGENLFGIAWSEEELMVIDCSGTFKVLHQTSAQYVEDVRWLDLCQYAVLFDDRVDVYRLQRVDANNDAVQDPQTSNITRYFPNLQRSISTGPRDAACFPSTSELMIFDRGTCGCEIRAYTWEEGSNPHDDAATRPIFKLLTPVSQGFETTAFLPLDGGHVVQGASDGYLRLLSLEQLCDNSGPTGVPVKKSYVPLNGYIIGFQVVTNFRTNEKYLAGGADDGSVAFWSMNTLEICGRWVLFNTALSKVVQVEVREKSSPLYGCALCVAEDGAVAVIVIDGFHFLYLVPGASTRLESICLGGSNLLLTYADHRCRLWDVQTKEFWRSMSTTKADELLEQGGWTRIDLDKASVDRSTVWSVPAMLPKASDAASTLCLQTERFISNTISLAKTISTSRDTTRAILNSLDQLRTVLSTLITPGLNPDVDSVCYTKLGISRSNVLVGLATPDAISIFNTRSSKDLWCISGNVTAARLLGIVVVLKAVALYEEYAAAASRVISFYTTSLSSCVGEAYSPPSLPYLASLWFQGSTELRSAIRVVFDTSIAAMTDEEASLTVENWQYFVPCLQLPSERESLNAALSLFICGYIAAEKYSFMSAPVLRDISKSISMYLLDEKSSYRVLAIDLCSRGFNVWQHYIDAMEILRSLFMLATTAKKNDISPQNVGTQARAAVLLIATNNTPLFMSTLGLDILTPPTLENRRAVLQIVAFLIRKRPSVLQPNLPKLMEAVVKSLDPNNTTNRDAVLDTATEIIGYVVKTFPTVDFHMTSQRLAVGTHEGAVIMYDLKTAIRLFVLEGHKKPITALSFSPDGRRLLTLSLEENVVLVWKVGTSFISFFTPGVPPRQGNSGGQPFKTFNFNIGSEVGEMSATEVLHQVKFDWTSDRNFWFPCM